ncbi:MAG: aminotransferase class V-fold PLP-dependent enzyme [Bacilli bacterium]|nr:aminotransferase class V-fold PLP-dependent enzyme [Bacilli bacterium]
MKLDINKLRQEIIGNNTFFMSPYGKRLITYADYTASGRTLRFIENYLLSIQEVYGNTHTSDSYTGEIMTNLVKRAESIIKKLINANDNNYIIPVGTGSTAAIKKLCEILGLYITPGLKHQLKLEQTSSCCDSRYNEIIIETLCKDLYYNRPIVFVSGYEHHSNYLIWKESLAEVVEIAVTDDGDFDYSDLENKLNDPKYKNKIKIGSFSACSNVTGVKTDVYRVAKLMHKYGGLVFFDFAASAPYVEINMNKDAESYLDAIFISPHKFIGGPGSCGLLVINKNLYSPFYPPTVAGGGTVSFVSPYCYKFVDDVEARENAGTPGILQILKASLAFEFKDHFGINNILTIEDKYLNKALASLSEEPNIIIYGPKDHKKRISIISFNIKHQEKLLHHKFVSRLLNDLFGIQSRAGCACAGPYAHRLLKIDQETSNLIESRVNVIGALRPGFVRISFHYLMSDEDVNYIIEAIKFIARYGYLLLSQYKINLHTGVWRHNYLYSYNNQVDSFGILSALDITPIPNTTIKRNNEYNKYLQEAYQLAEKLRNNFIPHYQQFPNLTDEKLRWFNFQLFE